LASKYCLGIDPPDDPFLPQTNLWFFASYTIAAVIYRWIVVLSILMFLNTVLEPYGLKIVGQVIGFMGVFGLVAQPIWQLGKFFNVPGRMHQVKRKNVLITTGVAAAAILFFVACPLPYSVKCAVQIKPSEAERAIVKTPGRLEKVHVRTGEPVKQGDILAELSNVDLEVTIEDADRQRRAYETQLVSLRDEQHHDGTVNSKIPAVEKALESTNDNLASLRQQQGWLKIAAPVDGIVMPAEEKKGDPEVEGRLPTWTGSLLWDENLGARVEMNDNLCLVGDPHTFEALLVVDQVNLPFIHEGQRVRIRLDAYANETLRGEIAEIAHTDMEISPPALSNQQGGELATKTDKTGMQRPQSASYEARVPMTDVPVALRAGLRGRAKISASPQPLAARCWRLLTRTFHFRL
jgi:putative peptide zinc metalloprotease protein